MTWIRWFNDISIKDVSSVGGKTASLGEMYKELTGKGMLRRILMTFCCSLMQKKIFC